MVDKLELEVKHQMDPTQLNVQIKQQVLHWL